MGRTCSHTSSSRCNAAGIRILRARVLVSSHFFERIAVVSTKLDRRSCKQRGLEGKQRGEDHLDPGTICKIRAPAAVEKATHKQGSWKRNRGRHVTRARDELSLKHAATRAKTATDDRRLGARELADQISDSRPHADLFLFSDGMLRGCDGVYYVDANQRHAARAPFESMISTNSGGGGAASNGEGAAAERRRRRLGFMVVASPDDKKARASLQERMAIKAQALALVGAAAATAYWTDLVHLLLEDERVHRGYFRLASLCFGVDIAVAAHRVLWIQYAKRRGSHDSGGGDTYAIHHPQLLPAATAAGVAGAFFLVRSLWPVWGFLAPLNLLVMLTGLVFSLHFVPWPFS